MGKKSYKNSTRTWYIEGKLIMASNIQKLRKKNKFLGKIAQNFKILATFLMILVLLKNILKCRF